LNYLFERFSIFEAFNAGWDNVKLGVTNFIEATVNAFTALQGWFKNFNLLEFLLEKFEAISSNVLSAFGIDLDLAKSPAPIAAPAALRSSESHTPKGGISRNIASMITNNRSSAVSDIHMHNYGQAPNGQQLIDDLATTAG